MLTGRTTALLALAELYGCIHVDVYQDDGAIDPPREQGSGSLELSEVELDFGDVELGSESIEGLFLTNLGDGTLHITSMEFTPSSAPFWIDTPVDGAIDPGASSGLTMGFAPDAAGTHSAWLRLYTNEPEVHSHAVFLSGEGLGGELNTEPDPVEPLDGVPGCSQRQRITLTNTGTAPLQIDGVTLTADSDELTLLDEPDLPFVLDLGERWNLWLAYEPIDQGEDRAILSVQSSDAIAPERQLSILGSCPEATTVQDSFVWQSIEGVDVLVALDRSAMMSSDLEYHVEQLTQASQMLTAMGVDYQLALAVTDEGCGEASELFVQPSHSEDQARALLTEMAWSTWGWYLEMGFSLLEATLAETGPGGCNEGLVREGTGLHLVGISDDAEQSRNSWSYYVALYVSYLSSPDDLRIHAVGGDDPEGCEIDEHYSARAYTGFYEATKATGGSFISICSEDWGIALAESIAENQGGTEQLVLALEPVPESIELWIDGVQHTEGWSWSTSSGVLFDADHRPSDGSEIEVDYTITESCD